MLSHETTEKSGDWLSHKNRDGRYIVTSKKFVAVRTPKVDESVRKSRHKIKKRPSTVFVNQKITSTKFGVIDKFIDWTKKVIAKS